MKTIIQKNNRNHGVALLFTIITISVLFVIVFGTLNIAVNEANFSVSAKKANEAFFAADVGAECALFYDKNFYTIAPTFPATGSSGVTIDCNARYSSPPSCDGSGYCTFYILSIDDSSGSCAKVTVSKPLTGLDSLGQPLHDSNGNISYNTKIISKGYNAGGSGCAAGMPNIVERELELNY